VVETRTRFQRHRPEHMRGLSQSVRLNVGLLSDASPCSVKAAVEPEACFVSEENYSAAGASFFLIAGRRLRTQTA
jgi:hypothetical protein